MESEYDQKFEEMKKYIPFLENMIKRLESTSQASAHPRQAQLDKIRSLRVLLLNKKKRMKMENLLKCEQVLINLYAKVEQRDTLSGVKKGQDPGFSIDPPTPQEKSDLEAVRNKLKNVAKRQEEVQETLPEILRVDEVQEMQTAGSKEPALFQRRPNKSSLSPTHISPTKIKEDRVSPSASKRNYTRVLVSPDKSGRRWPESVDDKPLFSRRSPRRSPRRYSPSYHKKERKKSLKESGAPKSKDLNITLKVPEDSLSTLNTKDIFTRIINCKDGDVDIDTLRELRKQILTELKKTGARDDISDLILKSYNKKKRISSKKEEVEEGELSDSESEVIENVYGSLSGNLVLKDQNETKTSTDKDKARKIQICLVINSDKNNCDPKTNAKVEIINNSDVSELEMYEKESKEVNKTNEKKNEQDVIKIDDDVLLTTTPEVKNKEHSSSVKETSKNTDTAENFPQPPEEESKAITPNQTVKYTANFYKPLTDTSESEEPNKIKDCKEVTQAQVEIQKESDIKTDTKSETSVSENPETKKDVCAIEAELEQMEKSVEIPLLNEPTIPKKPADSTLSEIDILQALKNEILSETITIPGSEAGTPLLHQPKVNKVASAKEILPKKRISIENYKQKIVSSTRFYFDDNDSKDDLVKKPSLKLTEKECERFNIQKKMSFEDDSSDGDDESEIQASDLYSDLAPKSPDHDESSNMESTPPVIIPGDPVKSLPVNRNADIDMRTLPILSPSRNKAPSSFSSVTGFSNNDTISTSKTDTKTEQIKSQNRPVLLDPRVKRDINSSHSPSPHTVNPDRTPRPAYSNIIKSPATNAAMTPNARSYEMTPTRQSFEIDQPNKKHVYMPSFGMTDCKDRENSVAKDSKIESFGERKSRFDDIGDTSSWSSSDVSVNTRYTDSFSAEKYSKGPRKDRYSLDNRESFSYKRSECPKTPNIPFGRSEVPVTSTQTFGRLDKPMTPMHSFGRAECPTTPSHYFGRSECPPTPSHSFGRSDCPLTPSHPFGRSECPSTPNHPFGRSECPPTPSHPFGRIECPPTPSVSFGRSDCPSTPSHPFGSHSFNNYERPLTPSHQYGAIECPSTPYYGRNECPSTPNHGFGRSDCPSTPSHPFGRSDFNAHKYNKDPRLNRKPEYESNSQLNERDRGYYKDRGYYHGSSYKSQKAFGGSDSYINQDRELERNSKYRYYAPDQTGRHISRDNTRREQTIGSSRTNDQENDRMYSRERGQYNSDNSGYEDVALRRGQQRERSVGRSMHPEDKRERSVGRHVLAEDTHTRSSSRGPSIRRNSSIEPENKSLSVKSHGGRSFTIDTSVNATFQKFLESNIGSHVESNFDSRRQRAASVGRSLARSSRWEPVTDESKQNSKIISNRYVFRRASSVGRDLADSSADKRSFQEIKADFKTYRHPVKESKSGKISLIDTNTKNNYEDKALRRERDSYDKYKEVHAQSSSKLSYSPRKNSRDPRMRKENNIKSKYEDSRSRKSGIVYSNDNIVKGAILTSGYGVKNYKIPKIKRAVEEKEVEIPKKDEPVNKKDVKEKDKRKDIDRKREEDEAVQDKARDKSIDKNKVTLKPNIKDSQIEKKCGISKHKNKEATMGKINDLIKETNTKSDTETEKDTIEVDEPDEQVGRRSTRLSKKLAGTNTGKDAVAKTKKSKKSIISDSDSETDNSVTEKLFKANANETDLGVMKPTQPHQVTASPVKKKIESKQPNAVDIHTNFGLELELFSDNVVSDPVLENINALIADLDNDLDSSKNESSNNFTNEITLENMLQNITSPRHNSSENRDEFTKVLEDVAELSKANENKVQIHSLFDLNEENKVKSIVADVHTDVNQELKNTEDSSLNKYASQSSDDMLATVKPLECISAQNEVSNNKKDEALNSSLLLNKPTNDDIVSTTEIEKDTMLVEDKSKIDERSMDGCSTPDSTINTDVLDKNKTGDCVADSTNEEGHSETNVSSTDSVEPKPSSSSKETSSDLELGNLLTVLQDKSKIKKLLSMLGDQSGDNDRIRKKLEKLSEIVSEDEMDEKSEEPEKSKTEVLVPTDDKISEKIQTVDENKKEETESQSNDIDQTKLNKNDEESQLNKVDEQENDAQSKEESFEDFAGDDSFEPETELQVTKTKYKKKIPAKKTKFSKKGKGRYAKKVTSNAEKRVTRATAAVGAKNKPKKPPRELQQLHEDIKEMFIRDDILSATGIRMCRLAKMVDEKPVTKDEIVLPETEPVVVLEKFKNTIDKSRDNPIPEKVRKKPGPKPKPKISTDMPVIGKPKYKPGPKSKTKAKKEVDPYVFEVESAADAITEKASDDESDHSSDSEVGSLASSKSFGSSEVLAEIKKKNKRKRGRGWQDGVIKPKNKKKKVETKLESSLETPDCKSSAEKQIFAPDMQCFTDRNYCFRKNEFIHSCRLCAYTGTDIVHHYVNEHPHVEIPMSRMAPALAKEAIEQCKEINFKEVSKMSSAQYVCIFCYQEFPYSASVLETFFWHVVSMHTGEYKHTCGECSSESRCPFSLDIPPPPKETKGQLIGFICKKCHFTQLSLENLKNHVIRRHNDEQTAVYTINLSAMTKEMLKEFLGLPEQPLAANSSLLEIKAKPSDEANDDAEIIARVSEPEEALHKPAKNMDPIASIKSKITFEADDNVGELSGLTSESCSESIIKIERVETETTEEISQEEPPSSDINEINQPKELDHQPVLPGYQEQQLSLTAVLADPSSLPSNDIVDYPHFKISFTESGSKEYICCINGKDNHFKTTLLISMKKHVQFKHSENWDGYCFICKVIVTPQGAHKYKECFQHYLDKHMDNFPIYQKEVLPGPACADKENKQTDSPAPSKPLINVRPINELMTALTADSTKETPSFPVIQSVMSLGAESPQINPTYPVVRQNVKPTGNCFFKYEEVQAKVMSNKHRVVLENMMVKDKLIKVYKCAGRFCSFSSDSAEDALLHASTHQRIGGIDALNCSYCDFDAMDNAIDLVMHVFKEHGNCQYSCQHCFYRAASSQAVAAHAHRLHGIKQDDMNVLRTTVATNTPDEGEVLTREEAVQSYVCQLQDDGSICNFHCVTPDKFCEHVLQKHNGATKHSCHVCHKETSSTMELIDHMKSHGIQLYQCAWCVQGADSQDDLLAHVSVAHPTKQPQAYLRIVTNNGRHDLRVLPLAFLNKIAVPTEDVTPSAVKENPVREAERSIDLEKLISLTMAMEPQLEPEAAPEPAKDSQEDTPEAVQPSVAPIASVVPVVPVPEVQAELFPPVSNIVPIAGPSQTNISDNHPLLHTPAVTVAVDPSLTISKVPIKAEVAETPATQSSEVVVLDSDDEDTRQPVIDLSDEDNSTSTKTNSTNQKVPIEILSTCPKCQQICKSINGLKKHFYYCYPNKEEGSKCAHCPYMASSRDNIMHHYMHDHCDRNVYQCGVCRVNLVTLAIVKRHLKYVHKEKDFVVTSTVENGIACYVVNVAKKEKKEVPKRKLSANATETLSKRRFWPQEVNQLPINPILDHLVYCEICEFSTKVRLNMVRHLQLHAEQQPAPQTAPVNPVPHLETNEKHFDKMVNLASSSLGSRPSAAAPERPAAVRVSRDVAARFPQHVPARQRNTCGAAGCSYTSVDEAMLRRHWEALHDDAGNAYRCVHCPTNQTTDCTRPITGLRVVQHLKMHDDSLYACSTCYTYHYKRDFMEKHIMDYHPSAQLYIIRESAEAAAAATSPAVASPSAAPTMDLKPWQCGLCKFKSMLRPEVVEHCFKMHQSKMQFRCGYCPYRASVLENVNNHLAHSHAGEPSDVIHYYYREGALPDAPDGRPRWSLQRLKLPAVKTELDSEPAAAAPPPAAVDLNLVKKEVDDAAAAPDTLHTMEDLCTKFGQFCEPNGIKYKCPLCSIITEDTREAMQSHLYEELQYRKWGCGLCNYKAFHKAGLTEHMSSEHFRQYDHIELPIDVNKEKWVTGQLDHQAAIITKHKANLAKQKIVVERVNKPLTLVAPPPSVEVVEKYSVTQLEEAFGEFGAPSGVMYCCPKCSALCKDEPAMRDHLETELNKIRWGCTNCSEKYQTYHEAQFHCKGHDGPSRPKEAVREPAMRAAWVSNIIQAQKKILQSVSVTPATSEPCTSDSFTDNDNNSLLVVRYEERVPTPDLLTASRKRTAPESDDERLVIDEGGPKKKTMRSCPHCNYKCKYYNPWKEHVLKHHNLKPYSCCYCDFSCSYRQGIIGHTEKSHPGRPMQIKMTAIPPAESYILSPKKRLSAEEETNVPKLICLFCENSVPETDIDNHLHENIRPDFAKKGDVVVKCCICLVLRLDVKSLQEHHNLAHPHVQINYAWFKLHHDTRETHVCGYCDDIAFKFIRDLKSHHNAVHPTLLFKYTTIPYVPALDDYKESKKKEESPLQKRCARKSTTKLPCAKTVAKKSTTKLPYCVPNSSDDGYSYYKTKPDPLDKYANVTTLMSFCNRMMPFTLKKLSEIINIDPKVIVKDYRAGTSSDVTLI